MLKKLRRLYRWFATECGTAEAIVYAVKSVNMPRGLQQYYADLLLYHVITNWRELEIK